MWLIVRFSIADAIYITLQYMEKYAVVAQDVIAILDAMVLVVVVVVVVVFLIVELMRIV